MFPTPGPKKESGRREHVFLSWSPPPRSALVSPSRNPTESQQGERLHLSPQGEDPQREVDREGRGPAWRLQGERGRSLPIQCPSSMPLLGWGDGSLSTSKNESLLSSHPKFCPPLGLPVVIDSEIREPSFPVFCLSSPRANNWPSPVPSPF